MGSVEATAALGVGFAKVGSDEGQLKQVTQLAVLKLHELSKLPETTLLAMVMFSKPLQISLPTLGVVHCM